VFVLDYRIDPVVLDSCFPRFFKGIVWISRLNFDLPPGAHRSLASLDAKRQFFNVGECGDF
jgi:hypothetical protein